MSEVIASRAQAGRPVLGICGGFQMLAEEISDDVESGAGTVSGLGLLPASVTFAEAKTLGRPAGTAYGVPVSGYEVHHGQVTVRGIRAEPFLDGCRSGAVWGTSWHGTLQNDQFRRSFLTDVAAFAGRDFKPAADTSFAALREASLDLLGDLVADNLDTDAVLRLIEGGPPPGLPALPPAGARS
jgi:adenosylcobyric acid synthase